MYWTGVVLPGRVQVLDAERILKGSTDIVDGELTEDWQHVLVVRLVLEWVVDFLDVLVADVRLVEAIALAGFSDVLVGMLRCYAGPVVFVMFVTSVKD